MLAVQEFWGKEKNFTMEKKQNHFSGQLGFVLAAAGSAVGVGNLWRFPYLAAKDGGGLFLIIYFILVLTFGFTLLTSDIAIGRRTHKSAIGAYEQMRPKWKGLGILTFLVPVLIMTYYAVIGGWITKYAVVYVSGQASAAAADDYFTSFITSPVSPVVFALLFMGVTALIVYNGVQNGIEKVSRWMMPVLLVLVVVIACYSLTLSHTNADGQVVTGWQGFLYYLTPNLEGLTVQRFLQILLDAMSQLFFSLSVSMGIMITYGSYVHPEVDLNRAVNQIEIFDTGVAFLAGMMIIPAVYVFSGTEGMGAGPSLMFISLPMVFDSMKFGTVIGAVFFLLVLFAALTSSIALMETLASVIMDKFKLKRIPATLIIIAVCLVVGMLSCLGYGPWESVTIIGMQFLDFFDFISNSVLMPIVAVLTCVLIGHVVGTKVVADEVKSGAGSFRREKLHRVMIRWIAPVLLVAILASELASKIFGVFSI
mgnify:CR=1 FL=1